MGSTTGIGGSRSGTLRGDLVGGLVSAVVALPLAMGYGMFAFGPLGDSYFAYGALAGLYAAVVAGFACVALGDRTTTVYAPRITTTFFLGALLYDLIQFAGGATDSARLDLILLAFFATILLGGAFQALFGFLRVGSLLRFTPHPVMAGLQNAAAALLFLVQLANVCGFDRSVPFTAVGAHLAEVRPLSLVVALATFAAMWNARAITTKVPPLIVGLGLGSAFYFALVAAGLGAYLGPVIGLPGAVESPAPINHIVEHADAGTLSGLVYYVVSGALALAFVAALDALLCAKLVTAPGAPRADGDRLLARLGLANMASAAFGGITSGINIGPSVTNRDFGAKTTLSVMVNAAALLLVILALFPVVSQLPRAVLSAAIMVIAVQHIDPWSIDLVRRLRAGTLRHRRLMLLDLAVIALVAVLAVTVNIVLAVFLGIVIAIALFVARMSRSNIRRLYRCDMVHSRKVRMPEQAVRLEKVGADILVIELDGALFFGSAEKLSEDIEREARSGTRTVILDLKRVTEIDSTGVRILGDIRQLLAHKDQRLVLALPGAGALAARLAEAGILDAVGGDRVFPDIDRAIEWAEDNLLQDQATDAESEALPLSAVDICAGLSAGEIARLENHMERTRHAAGSVIFREGDPGKELLVLSKGHASAHLAQPDGGDVRLATFAPGTVFGELAILDAGPRSATVIADDDVECYVLSRTSFAALESDAPAIAIRVLANLGGELSVRLRRANRTIHQLEM